jgi:hypothetical protein
LSYGTGPRCPGPLGLRSVGRVPRALNNSIDKSRPNYDNPELAFMDVKFFLGGVDRRNLVF